MRQFFAKYYNLAMIILSLVLLGLNYKVLQDLFSKWYPQGHAGPYSHGLLVAFIAVYIVYKKIVQLRTRLYVNPSYIGLIFLAGSVVVLFLSSISGVNFLQHIALLSALFSIVWFAYSFNIARQFILPVILLLLTFPAWIGAEYFLQIITIHTTSFLLNLTGVPFYRDGPFFHFASGIIEIAPECAGYQQMLVSLILGLLFSYQHQLRIIDTIKTLFYLSIAAIVINTIRIIIIMIVGYYTKMESSLITKHILLGWIIYGIGIFIFLYFYSGLKFKRVPSKETVTGEHDKQRFLARHPFVVQLLLIALVIFPSLLTYAITEHINGQPVRPVRLHFVSDTWKQSSGDIPFNWKPDFPVPDSHYSGTYRNKQDAVYVNILNYQYLKAGVEPLNMDNRPYNRGSWSLLRHKVVTLKHGEKRQMHAKMDVIVSRSGDRMIVLNYYLINGKVAINLVRSKFYTLLGMLHFSNDIKVVCLATKQEPGETSDSAYLRLRNFIRSSSNLN